MVSPDLIYNCIVWLFTTLFRQKTRCFPSKSHIQKPGQWSHVFRAVHSISQYICLRQYQKKNNSEVEQETQQDKLVESSLQARNNMSTTHFTVAQGESKNYSRSNRNKGQAKTTLKQRQQTISLMVGNLATSRVRNQKGAGWLELSPVIEKVIGNSFS